MTLKLNEEKFLEIIGKNIESEILKDFFFKIKEEPLIEEEKFGLPDDNLECSFKNNGLLLMFNNQTLITIMIFLKESDRFKVYKENFNSILNSSLTMNDVTKIYGDSDRINTIGEHSFGLLTPKWMVYDYPKHTLHLEFNNEGDKLSQITIMTPEASPGRELIS